MLRGVGAALLGASLGHGQLSQPLSPMGFRTRQTFRTFTLFFNTSASATLPVAEFPQIELMTTPLTFQESFQIVGFDLSAGFAATEGAPAGVFLTVGKSTPKLALGPTSGIIGSALAPFVGGTNSANVNPGPIFFDEDLAIPLPSGSPLALYACNIAVRTIAQAMFGTANVYLATP